MNHKDFVTTSSVIGGVVSPFRFSGGVQVSLDGSSRMNRPKSAQHFRLEHP